VITSPGDDAALSNLGWVDRGAIWLYDGATRSTRLVHVGEGSFLRVKAGEGSDSVVVEDGLPGRAAISVRAWAELETYRVRVEVAGRTARVEGDLAAFHGHKRLFVDFLGDDATGAGGYFLIEVGAREVRVRRLDWFDSAQYDHGYQRPLSALELPGGEYLFGVQRCSNLVMCDPSDLRVIREVPLAGRCGNPNPFLRGNGAELWVVDYDTVVRLDAATLNVDDRWVGQPPARSGHRMFLGDIWMSRNEQRLLVPRPGAGDVVELDPASLQVLHTWPTGRQPLEAAALPGHVVARDWKTGDLLSADAAE